MSEVVVTDTTPDTSAAQQAAEAAALEAGAKANISGGEDFDNIQQSADWVDPNAPASGPGKADTPPCPEGFPEKFWTGDMETSAAKLAESYAKLESAKSKPGDSPGDEGDAPSGDDASQQSAIDRAQATFAEKGELTDDDYAALEAEGIGRATVDAYIAGQQAATVVAHAAAGGADEYAKMIEWAGENLSAAEIDAYNAASQTGATQEFADAVAGLRAKFAAKSSSEPALHAGANGAAPVGDHFRSMGEMTAAMRDPRYKTDSAYRADVERKIANAGKAKVNLFQ